MAEVKRTLPEFIEAPVIETLFGVQFKSLEKFSIPHYGLYWSRIRANYEQYEVHPPVRSIIEQFGAGISKDPSIGFHLMRDPEVRCWFIDKSRSWLTQIQRDRFYHNWRKVKVDDVYPRYEKIKPKFKEEWLRFCEFLDEADLGKPEVNQCEVMYVNHIEVGRDRDSYGQLNRVISCWSGSYSGTFLSEPESVNINAQYILPEKKGRLHIVVQPAIRRQDAKEVLQLNLTARGKPASSSLEDIIRWLDLGHEWIVRGFADFTTKEMHKIWRRTI